MKFSLSALAAASLLVAVPWAAAQNVAIVNGKAVPTARVEALAKQVQASGRQLDEATRAQLKEEVIMREVFMQEAEKRGAHVHYASTGAEANAIIAKIARMRYPRGAVPESMQPNFQRMAALASEMVEIAGRTAAARLSSRLLLPLGACTLPAFLFLGVAPLILSVLSTTPLPFA